jgi:fructose-6-phosphate aldolase 2
MEIYIDSANAAVVEELCRFFPVAGVTTNPTIIAREKGDFKEILLSVRAAAGERLIHAQVTAETAEGMCTDARDLHALLGDPFAVKVPVTKEGLRATPMLKAEGFTVTATAIFSPVQAVLAAAAGADYAAPYINRFDTVCGDGIQLVRDIAGLYEKNGYGTKILAASFKNAEQVHKCASVGCHSVTVTADILKNLISHPMTDAAIAGFDKDWKGVYGNQTISDF